MPIAQLHPDAKRKSEAIWCASDRAAAWANFWKSGNVPASADCSTPIDEISALAGALGVRGTPTLIRAVDGAIMPGAAPKDVLENWLSGK
jgi:thiol:disulfide interchange protein DsbC